MPYASQAQRRTFHAMLARGEISPATVAEYDRASQGMKLPERVKRRVTARRKESKKGKGGKGKKKR